MEGENASPIFAVLLGIFQLVLFVLSIIFLVKIGYSTVGGKSALKVTIVAWLFALLILASLVPLIGTFLSYYTIVSSVLGIVGILASIAFLVIFTAAMKTNPVMSNGQSLDSYKIGKVVFWGYVVQLVLVLIFVVLSLVYRNG